MNSESLYRQLGQLVAEAPNLNGPGTIDAEMLRWLGRASVLIAESGDIADHVFFKSASNNLTGMLRETNAHQILTILHRALARAEQNAPLAIQGAFIPVGAAFDAFQAIGKVLDEAKVDVLVVDPYIDSKVLTDFAPLVAERVSIRLLTDSKTAKPPTLRAATDRWIAQYGQLRPLEVRMTAPRQLHDRLIIVDREKVWTLTQSIAHFAARSPASVLRAEQEVAALKVEAYEELWNSATAI